MVSLIIKAIQLLSQEEHLEAHKGDWHNVTNWYYDPDTKTFYDFEVYDYSKFPPDDYINFRPEEAIIPVDSSSEESQEKQAEENKPPEKKSRPNRRNPKRALDGKIELNNRINENLELQAQALFKKVIVNNCSKENGVLGDCCIVKSGFAFKSSW